MGIANSVSMAFSEENKGESRRDEEETEDSNETKEEIKDSNETKEEEEIEECPLCKYIKGGECKESFIALEKCVDESEQEEGEATKCNEVRKIFKTCMFDNPVYYEPLITRQARVVARMIISELHAEKEAVLAADAAAIAKALSKLQTEDQPVLPAEVAAIAKAFQDLEADMEEIAKGNE